MPMDDHSAHAESNGVGHSTSSDRAEKKRKKKTKRKHNEGPGERYDLDHGSGRVERREKSEKEKKCKKRNAEKFTREKKKRSKKEDNEDDDAARGTQEAAPPFPFDHRHILAPMVGASELAFRLLCRKYGATLAYTPMMSARQFVQEAATATTALGAGHVCEFQTVPGDRPLVAHFCANDPADFAAAAALVAPHCDAIDLNLGCPQRTAYLGHFGSYLLGDDDRARVLDIVRAGSRAAGLPVFVKIRLLATVGETLALCRQLRDAGAALIAIHARCTCLPGRVPPRETTRLGPLHSHLPFFCVISTLVQIERAGNGLPPEPETDRHCLTRWP